MTCLEDFLHVKKGTRNGSGIMQKPMISCPYGRRDKKELNLRKRVKCEYKWGDCCSIQLSLFCICWHMRMCSLLSYPYNTSSLCSKSQISFARLFLLAVLQHHFLHFSFLTLSFVKYFLFLGLNITFRVYIHNQAFLKLNEYTFQVIILSYVCIKYTKD